MTMTDSNDQQVELKPFEASNAELGCNVDHRSLACASQSAMDPLHHAFRNPHRNIAAFESTFGVTPLDHAGLASEHSTNGLLAQGPEAGQFTDRKMSFQRRFVGWSRDIAQPIGFNGGLFSCVHGASFAGGKIGCPTLDRLAGEILPQRSPKYRRLSEFTGPSASS